MEKVSEEQFNQYAVFQPKYCHPGGAASLNSSLTFRSDLCMRSGDVYGKSE